MNYPQGQNCHVYNDTFLYQKGIGHVKERNRYN